jgi:predicted TIM-barrel fold metal-dependent hydrolase
MSEGTRRMIDSHLHVWSDGGKYPWEVPPPDELKSEATYEKLIAAARRAGVSGALIVQPANHKYDHSYVESALRSEPSFFRGMCLANPTLPTAQARCAMCRRADGGRHSMVNSMELFGAWRGGCRNLPSGAVTVQATDPPTL